jgi:hypothetical protein
MLDLLRLAPAAAGLPPAWSPVQAEQARQCIWKDRRCTKVHMHLPSQFRPPDTQYQPRSPTCYCGTQVYSMQDPAEMLLTVPRACSQVVCCL